MEDEMLEAIEELDPDLAESLRIKYHGTGYKVEDEARPPTTPRSTRMIEVAGFDEEEDDKRYSSPPTRKKKPNYALKDTYLMLLTYMLMIED